MFSVAEDEGLHASRHLARIVHIEANNHPSGPFDMLTVPSPVEGLRLRPACAGGRSGLGSYGAGSVYIFLYYKDGSVLRFSVDSRNVLADNAEEK